MTTAIEAEPASPLTEAFFRALPKSDLHVHLDGSIRPATLLQLARDQGVTLTEDIGLAEFQQSSEADVRRWVHAGELAQSLPRYLEAFDVTLRVLQSEEALYRVAYELAQDAAAEHVRYMEVRYAPLLHTRRGLALTRVVEAVLRGLSDAGRDHAIKCRVILCGIRNISARRSLEMAELVVAYKGRGVVGFDLAGAEDDHPPKEHSAAFALVRRNNINVTIHAGEAHGPASIAQALHVCGAHRIGHGCRLREDGDLLHYVIDQRIPLECCPSSNVQTGAVESLEDHPMRLYFNLGARVTVNTDNRLVSDTTMSHELQLLHSRMGFRLVDIKQVLLNGFKSAFLPFHERQHFLAKISADLTRFHEDGSIDPPPPAASRDQFSRP